MLRQHREGRHDVLSPDTGPTAVRDEAGRIVAVRRLQAWAPLPVCPACGAVLDLFPDWEGAPPCGGDPTWHEEGVADITITIEEE